VPFCPSPFGCLFGAVPFFFCDWAPRWLNSLKHLFFGSQAEAAFFFSPSLSPFLRVPNFWWSLPLVPYKGRNLLYNLTPFPSKGRTEKGTYSFPSPGLSSSVSPIPTQYSLQTSYGWNLTSPLFPHPEDPRSLFLSIL